jgi:histidinol dehydrogenase
MLLKGATEAAGKVSLMLNVRRTAVVLAGREGLRAHAHSVETRFLKQ